MIEPYKFSNQFFACLQLTKRNMKLYFKDKATVFFSFLAPLIILLLYVLFLGRVQVDGVKSAMPEGFEVAESAVKAFVDNWLISGVLSVSCITVSLNTMTVMVSDKANKLAFDFSASPLKKSVVMLSYFFAGFFATLIMTAAVLIVSLIYLLLSGSYYLSFGNLAELLGILILSVLSATMIVMLLASFIKTESALGAFGGIISAMIGFVIGAYMPVSTFPEGIQYVSNIIPGSYSAGLFRNVLLSGALENLTAGMPEGVSVMLADIYSLKLNFFGAQIGAEVMYVLLSASVPLFFGINYLKFKFAKKYNG